jgi:hypothetical protein
MIVEHFYIQNDTAKPPFLKVNYENVIMVHSDGTSANFYIASPDKAGLVRVKLKISIADCYVKYFKQMDEFIRASTDYIVNINHIVGATNYKNGYMTLEMTYNNRASLRLSHLYAQKILRITKKPVSFASMPRDKTDSVKKDEIILEYPNPMQARKKIKEDLGEKVGIAYIRQRMKILSSYEKN